MCRKYGTLGPSGAHRCRIIALMVLRRGKVVSTGKSAGQDAPFTCFHPKPYLSAIVRPIHRAFLEAFQTDIMRSQRGTRNSGAYEVR